MLFILDRGKKTPPNLNHTTKIKEKNQNHDLTSAQKK
jgi:hypothetical protein